jgi:phenylalanyl-tRNA synthetase beta chain
MIDRFRRADVFQNDKSLSRYLPIIRDSPVYPVIYDSKRTVCSLPPVINGDHSKISPSTRNVFIEITALDKTKVEIVNHILVTMFSHYTEEPFTLVMNLVACHGSSY